jgi:hypothetical protein
MDKPSQGHRVFCSSQFSKYYSIVQIDWAYLQPEGLLLREIKSGETGYETFLQQWGQKKSKWRDSVSFMARLFSKKTTYQLLLIEKKNSSFVLSKKLDLLHFSYEYNQKKM